jgi:hypothetical protein
LRQPSRVKPQSVKIFIVRRRRKKEEGRGKREEGRGKREEGRGEKSEGRRK